MILNQIQCKQAITNSASLQPNSAFQFSVSEALASGEDNQFSISIQLSAALTDLKKAALMQRDITESKIDASKPLQVQHFWSPGWSSENQPWCIQCHKIKNRCKQAITNSASLQPWLILKKAALVHTMPQNQKQVQASHYQFSISIQHFWSPGCWRRQPWCR